MVEHKCEQLEVIGQLKEASRRQEKASERLFKIIEGDDQSGGLASSVVVLIQKIDQIPSPGKIKMYALLGGGAAIFMCFAGMLVFKAIVV